MRKVPVSTLQHKGRLVEGHFIFIYFLFALWLWGRILVHARLENFHQPVPERFSYDIRSLLLAPNFLLRKVVSVVGL